MGYELDKLMRQFGVSTPGPVPYTGSTAADDAAYQQYLRDYAQRLSGTNMYAPSPWSDQLRSPVFAAPPAAAPPAGSPPAAGGGGGGGPPAGGVVGGGGGAPALPILPTLPRVDDTGVLGPAAGQGGSSGLMPALPVAPTLPRVDDTGVLGPAAGQGGSGGFMPVLPVAPALPRIDDTGVLGPAAGQGGSSGFSPVLPAVMPTVSQITTAAPVVTPAAAAQAAPIAVNQYGERLTGNTWYSPVLGRAVDFAPGYSPPASEGWVRGAGPGPALNTTLPAVTPTVSQIAAAAPVVTPTVSQIAAAAPVVTPTVSQIAAAAPVVTPAVAAPQGPNMWYNPALGQAFDLFPGYTPPASEGWVRGTGPSPALNMMLPAGAGVQNFSRGGAVKGYALGGLNESDEREDFAGLAERYNAPLPEIQEPRAPVAPAAPAAEQPMDLQAMLAKYMQPGASTYGAELATARRTAERETQEFQRLLQQAIAAPAEAAPSKAELYFRLAAAFAEPGKTGSFGEGLGRAAGAIAEQKKAEREAQKASAAQRLQLGLTAQQARMQAAKEDVGTLRTLAGEEEKSKRAVATELLKEWVKKNDPVSTAGKQAQDEGLAPGTPQFQARVREISELAMERQTALINATVAQMGATAAQVALAQGREARVARKEAEAGSKLSPTELKLKTETEDLLASADSAMDILKQAYKLNPSTFDNSLPDLAQRKVLEAAGSKDKKLLATRTLENLLGEQALAKLKSTFGAAPTEGERKILMDLSGVGAKSIEERDAIIKNAFRVLRSNRERQAKRLNEITQGLYRNVSSPSGDLE